MILRDGDVLAGRFEIRGDEEVVRRARDLAARSVFPFRGEIDFPDEADLWLRGVDRSTGAPVLIEPRGLAHCWESDIVRETRARKVAVAAPPFVAPVLLAGPRVVYSAPPPGLPRGTFTRAEAAELALQVCEAAARLHEAGVAGLCFDPLNLRVASEGGRARAHWLVPGASDLELASHVASARSLGNGAYPRQRDFSEDAEGKAVERDIEGILSFFFSLQSAGSRASKGSAKEMALLRKLESDEGAVAASVAALARLLLPLAEVSAEVASRVAAMAPVSEVPAVRLDWDHVIADGEGEIGEVRHEGERDYIALPLAAAYHQRASRAWAAGNLASALGDVERALALDKGFLHYETTRALLLGGLGRTEEAYRVLEKALPGPSLEDAEQARAYATRGTLALRLGEPAKAAADLRRAMDFQPSGLHAHCLGAALFALGDFEAAAQAEERSVELCPAIPHYRWALAGTLRKLGRHREALAQAERAIAADPENALYRSKLAVLRASAEAR